MKKQTKGRAIAERAVNVRGFFRLHIIDDPSGNAGESAFCECGENINLGLCWDCGHYPDERPRPRTRKDCFCPCHSKKK